MSLTLLIALSIINSYSSPDYYTLAILYYLNLVIPNIFCIYKWVLFIKFSWAVAFQGELNLTLLTNYIKL